MSGVFGTKKPAQITSNDVDIYYYYRPSRSTESADFANFKKLNSSLLAASNAEDDSGSQIPLMGMYDLRLPLSVFGSVGIYTIYIKPREIKGVITDVSTLAAYPNIKGVVLDANDFETSDATIFANNGLVGYRIEYYDTESGTDKQDYYRIITSNNKCEPVAQNLNDSSQKGIRYRFNESSTLTFCTVTPSTSMSFKSSNTPYIGVTSQKVALVNTKFNPVMLEIEIVDHDIETISTMLEGDQSRNMDSGLITTYTKDGGIYHQANLLTVVNSDEGINHDVKITNKDSVVSSEADKFENIKNNI
jgi:hypothetical protein